MKQPQTKQGPDYTDFLRSKAQMSENHGFNADELPAFLYPFQQCLVSWALSKGRAAIFADCGLGKTPMSLAWSDQIVRRTSKRVLILTPLTVAYQFVREAEKFALEIHHSRDGSVAPITVTNYEKLHLFKPDDFVGVVRDESSILKNFDGATKTRITEFMRTIPFRLLCTATAAPNDFIEFGTSSEALGEMGYMDMLARFFKHDCNSSHPNHGRFSNGKWRFRGHAERDFWRWVCSWARAIKKPSDFGFSDTGFRLKQLSMREHFVQARKKPEGMLFDLPAHTLAEQREECRRTVNERCEKAAEVLAHDQPGIAWCNLNDESKLLAELIPDSVEICGDHSDDEKEEKIAAFLSGSARVLVSKPRICGLGLNLQHCAHQSFFPSHSFEQWYQAVRRSYRYGQKKDVTINIITTEGQARVLSNLMRKAAQATKLFEELVQLMNDPLMINRLTTFEQKEEQPKWL